jgi:hypothetical protein
MFDYDDGVLLAVLAACFILGVFAWRPAGLLTQNRTIKRLPSGPNTGRPFIFAKPAIGTVATSYCRKAKVAN